MLKLEKAIMVSKIKIRKIKKVRNFRRNTRKAKIKKAEV